MAFFAGFAEQARVFLFSAVLGLFLGLLYDAFRVIRVFLTGVASGGNALSARLDRIADKLRGGAKVHGVFKKCYTDIVVFLTDIWFGFVAAVVLTVFLFHANYGQLRLHIIFGCMLGFAVYYFTFGRLSATVTVTVVSALNLFLTFVYYKILCLFPHIFLKRVLKNKSIAKERNLLASAQEGFGCFAKVALKGTQAGVNPVEKQRKQKRSEDHGAE